MPKHVLCADDSITMQKVVAVTFANTEFSVSAARSTDEALALVKGRRPDLILADAVMPGRSGYDLCQQIKSDPVTRNIPVVILCGNASPYDEVRGRAVGADSFLVKPWDTTTFLEKVSEIMGRATTQGAAQPGARAVSSPPAPASGPHVVSRPSGVVPAQRATPTPAAPTSLGLPRPIPPAVPARPSTAPSPASGGLPKPPPGLPRPPLIRGAAPGAIRPGAAMPRVSGAAVAMPPSAANAPPAAAPVIAPPAAPTPPPPVVAPPAMVTPPPVAARPPHVQPRPPAVRSATIMGMPAVTTPPATPSHPPGPPPAHSYPSHPPAPTPPPAPVRAEAPPSRLPPAQIYEPPKPAPVTISPPVVAPRPAVTPPPPAPAAARPTPPPAAGDHRGPEYEAISKLSREIIERIVWEVVPDLAEAIIRENLHKFQK